MGMPDEWTVHISGGNFHHSAWYGCNIHYSNVDSPDTKKILTEDNKNMFFEKGIPDPFSGIYGKFKEKYEYMNVKIKRYFILFTT